MTEISAALLAWYDVSARVLPWRVPPRANRRADPYAVWLSEVMLQQTTVAAVKDYFRRFTTRWPDVAALAQAEDADVMAEWAGLGYYARARNLLKCAREIAARGAFPQSAAELIALPGIGPYTAAAIASIAFDEPVAVVDGNVERVVSRLFSILEPLPSAKPAITRATQSITPPLRAGDFAQAMMDLGATICTPLSPVCALCPLSEFCTGRAIADTLPRKAPKPQKPERRGVVWVAMTASGEALLETRPPKGLLGGTLGFPTTDWKGGPATPPLEADWQIAPARVRHTFTHFHLELEVHVALVAGEGFARVDPEALPTLMRKVWEAATAQ